MTRFTLALVALLMGLTACQRREVFLRFLPTEATGWERTELMTFEVDSLPRAGRFAPRLLVRKTADNRYPYRDLTLVVHQRWTLPAPSPPTPADASGRRYLVERPRKGKKPPPAPQQLIAERTDTVCCVLMTPEGHSQAGGVALQQYAFPIASLTLPQGARAKVTIRHLMRSDVIEGITDIGFSMEPAEQ